MDGGGLAQAGRWLGLALLGLGIVVGDFGAGHVLLAGWFEAVVLAVNAQVAVTRAHRHARQAAAPPQDPDAPLPDEVVTVDPGEVLRLRTSLLALVGVAVLVWLPVLVMARFGLPSPVGDGPMALLVLVVAALLRSLRRLPPDRSRRDPELAITLARASLAPLPIGFAIALGGLLLVDGADAAWWQQTAWIGTAIAMLVLFGVGDRLQDAALARRHR